MIGQNLRTPEAYNCGNLTESLHNSGTNGAGVDVPVRKADEKIAHNNIWDATTSQSEVLYKAFGKICELIEWEARDQKTKCVPLRLTVRGAAGTRKSFIINTIVSYMRRTFDDNYVVHVVSPTGMSSLNILG
jgi:hypothetical protein